MIVSFNKELIRGQKLQAPKVVWSAKLQVTKEGRE